MPIIEDFVLFAVTSEGKAVQWDERDTPDGALLRWLLPANLGFPPHGFDVYRGLANAKPFKLHHNAIPNAAGGNDFSLDTNTQLFSSRPLTLDGSGIRLDSGDELTLMFSSPVSVFSIGAGNSSGELQVRLVVGGKNFDEQTLHANHVLEWGTRGIDAVVISGHGVVSNFETTLRDGPYKWKKIAHLGLPLTHPNYPDSPPGDDFDLARSRLPAGAEWNGHYQQVFAGLHGLLKDMFDGVTDPFPPVPVDGGPSLQMDRRAALFLAMLDPNVARMLGYAYDHTPGRLFPRDGYMAFKVEALWNTDPAHRDIREAIFPALKLREITPVEPTALEVSIDEVAGRPRAGLRWQPVPLAGRTADPPILRYQVLARHVAGLADAPPAIVDLGQADLLGDDPLLLPAGLARAQPAEPFVYDRVAQAGHIAYGIRGVDIFGRVSKPIQTIERVDDQTRPPPPRILVANYLQSDAPRTGQAALSQAAHEWLQQNAGDNAFEVAWEWPPELAARAPDVDTFEVLVRLPVRPGSTGLHQAEIEWSSAQWGSARFILAPPATRLAGALGDVTPGLPLVAVSQVESLGEGVFRLRTDLHLDIGKAVLGRCQLRPHSGSSAFEILAHGDGRDLSVVVSGPPGITPAEGDYELVDNQGRIISTAIVLDAPGGVDQHHEGGTVVFTGGGRMNRLGDCQGRVLGLLLADEPGGVARLPADGERVNWFPSYRVLFEDTGFGPIPSPIQPLAQAQVSVRSLRPPSPFSGPRISSPATPHTVAAADYTRPLAPDLPELPSGPRCAQLASAADYYGISRFGLEWPVRPNERYMVYRALRDSLLKADREARQAGLPTHEFPADHLPADPQLQTLVQQEVATLDNALAGGDEAAISRAYEDLGAESVRLIASQDDLRPAFTALNSEPLEAASVPFEDQFDGRSRGSWIYRVAAISSGGLEGGWSMATPPICAPDVVAPPPPQVQEVLAAEGAIIIRWLKSPSPDLALYRLYRSLEPGITDPRDMEEIVVLATTPITNLAAGQVAPSPVAGQPHWLEFQDTIEGGTAAFYRLMAEDQRGNRSHPSVVSAGKALRAQPMPPVWNPPVRNGDDVELSWTHPDGRLACLVERRMAGDSAWSTVSQWLPRGVKQIGDYNPMDHVDWEYRLRVRDSFGLVASQRPVVSLIAELVN